VIKTSILAALISLIVSVSGFASQIVLATTFGATLAMDIYLIAISLPMFISGVINSALSYSLIPTLINNEKSKNMYDLYMGMFLIYFILISLIIYFTGYILSPYQVEILGSNLDGSSKQLSLEIARISWATAALMIFSGFLRGLVNANGKFLFSNLISVIPFLTTILGCVFLQSKYGLEVIALSTFFGFVILNIIILWQSKYYFKINKKIFEQFRKVLKYFQSIPLIIIGTLSFTVFQLVDAYWGSKITVGSVAYLGYVQRILVAIGTIVINGPSAVISHRLSSAKVEGRIDSLMNEIERALNLVLIIMLPIAIYVSTFSEPIIKILFERGMFLREDTIIVSEILQIMVFGLVAMISLVIIFRGLFAKEKIRLAATLGIITGLSYFTLSGILGLNFGLNGIAWAYLLTGIFVSFLGILMLFNKQYKNLNYKKLFILKLFMCCIVILVACIIGKQTINIIIDSNIILIAKLATIGVICSVLFVFATTKWFKIEDVELIYRSIISIRNKKL